MADHKPLGMQFDEDEAFHGIQDLPVKSTNQASVRLSQVEMTDGIIRLYRQRTIQ